MFRQGLRWTFGSVKLGARLGGFRLGGRPSIGARDGTWDGGGE